MTFLKIRDQSGATVVVNPAQVLYISQAMEAATKAPLFGFSVIFFQGPLVQLPTGQVQPLGITVRGTPEEIVAQMELMTGFAFEHASQ